MNQFQYWKTIDIESTNVWLWTAAIARDIMDAQTKNNNSRNSLQRGHRKENLRQHSLHRMNLYTCITAAYDNDIHVWLRPGMTNLSRRAVVSFACRETIRRIRKASVSVDTVVQRQEVPEPQEQRDAGKNQGAYIWSGKEIVYRQLLYVRC